MAMFVNPNAGFFTPTFQPVFGGPMVGGGFNTFQGPVFGSTPTMMALDNMFMGFGNFLTGPTLSEQVAASFTGNPNDVFAFRGFGDAALMQFGSDTNAKGKKTGIAAKKGSIAYQVAQEFLKGGSTMDFGFSDMMKTDKKAKSKKSKDKKAKKKDKGKMGQMSKVPSFQDFMSYGINDNPFVSGINGNYLEDLFGGAAPFVPFTARGFTEGKSAKDTIPDAAPFVPFVSRGFDGRDAFDKIPDAAPFVPFVSRGFDGRDAEDKIPGAAPFVPFLPRGF